MTRLGGRKRGKRTLSAWDRAQAPQHLTARTTCSASCGVMAEHKRRMLGRARARRRGQRVSRWDVTR